MKRWFVILFLAVLGPDLPAQDVLLHREYSSDGSDRRVLYLVPRDALERVPEWSPESKQKAPLGRDRAVEIARAAAGNEGLAKDGDRGMAVTLCKTNRYEKDILNRLPARGCRWFYLIEFPGEGAEKVRVLVTMSGIVARKEVENGK